MPALSDELSHFARAIVRGEEPSSWIDTSYQNYSVAIAIEVYRNNYRGNLHDTLAGAYPVIEQLVGKDFFRLLTRKFIEQHLSRGGNLHHYGAEMADFIASFEPARELVYLPEVAALEWACHCAYFAVDADTLNMARLAQVAPEHYPDLILHIHPSCHLLHSRYPVAAIWHAHQPGADSDFHIDQDSGPCNVLVSRNEDVVIVSELSMAVATWFHAIQSGVSLGEATDDTLNIHSDFNLQTTLLKLLQLDILVDIEVGE